MNNARAALARLPRMAILDATHNQNLHVMLNSGYFDLATPFFTADYEMKHLPISPAPMKNIETHYYESGHMVYAHLPSLQELHDNVAAFIGSTDNIGGAASSVRSLRAAD